MSDRGIYQIYHMIKPGKTGELICKVYDDRDDSFAVDGRPSCDVVVNFIWEHYTRNGYQVQAYWCPVEAPIKKLDPAVNILRNMKRRITIKTKKIRKNGIGLFDNYEYNQIVDAERQRALNLLNKQNLTCEVI